MPDTGSVAPPRGWRSWAGPMRARSVDEAHRASTPLELFFDLCFVVAVAQAAERCTTRWPRATSPKALVRYLAGVLRHLVGVDELHVVRVGVRHRRRRPTG